MVAVLARTGRKIGQRGARIGFGHRHGHRRFAPHDLRNNPFFERSGPEPIDRAHRPHQRFEYRERHCIRDHGELFEHQKRFEMAEPQPAILLGKIDAEKPHLPIAPHHGIGDGKVLGLHLARQIRQFFNGKGARRILKLALLLGKPKVHDALPHPAHAAHEGRSREGLRQSG